MTTEVNEEYKFGKLDALSQFHIVRRLAPIVGDLVAMIANSGAIKSGKKFEDMKFEEIDFSGLAKDIGPVMVTLAKLPDEDMNYALFGLLKCVTRKIPGGGWGRITTDQNHFMFDDVKGDLKLMMTLAGKALAANLGGFINALPSALKEGALNSPVSG